MLGFDEKLRGLYWAWKIVLVVVELQYFDQTVVLK